MTRRRSTPHLWPPRPRPTALVSSPPSATGWARSVGSSGRRRCRCCLRQPSLLLLRSSDFRRQAALARSFRRQPSRAWCLAATPSTRSSCWRPTTGLCRRRPPSVGLPSACQRALICCSTARSSAGCTALSTRRRSSPWSPRMGSSSSRPSSSPAGLGSTSRPWRLTSSPAGRRSHDLLTLSLGLAVVLVVAALIEAFLTPMVAAAVL